MQVSPLDIEEELTRTFPGLNADFMRDLAHIGAFLTSVPMVEDCCDVIEKSLEKKVFGQAGAPNAPQLQRVKDYYAGWRERHAARAAGKRVPRPDASLSHVVTTELARIEREAGFNLAGISLTNPHRVTLMMPLGEKKFRANLRSGRTWKDIVNPNHGEYTHRLQWCFLLVSGAATKLTAKPIDIYKQIGTLEPVTYGPLNALSYTVWDAIFDRQDGADIFQPVSQMDFRSPENLLTWLTTNKRTGYPLLCEFLFARKQKRTELAEEGAGAAHEYLALKLYGRSFSGLDPETRQFLDDYLMDGSSQEDASVAAGVGLIHPTTFGGYQKLKMPNR